MKSKTLSELLCSNKNQKILSEWFDINHQLDVIIKNNSDGIYSFIVALIHAKVHVLCQIEGDNITYLHEDYGNLKEILRKQKIQHLHDL
jgi:hypothetical protein